MKQKLSIKPELKIKQSFNTSKAKSLQILTMNNQELASFLHAQCAGNPFLSVQQKDSDAFLEYNHSSLNLSDEILSQMHLNYDSYNEELIYYLISMLDSNGYFKCTLQELISQSPYSKAQIQEMISILQTLEPVGCFSFNLKECLKIQCELDESAVSETGLILCDYLEDIASSNFNKIEQETDLSYEEIIEGLHFIQTINPKPAANYSIKAAALQADIKISYDSSFHFELVNNTNIYFEDMDNITQELRDLRNQAKFILSSIEKRNTTLLMIVDTLCKIQKDFFIYNKPVIHCTLQDVASRCSMHPSTVSRAISNKGFEFNNRYYPIRSLFSCSGTNKMNDKEIKKIILTIIEHENKVHPYSDEKIKNLLSEYEIYVSRRTITKYREALFIENASKRKKTV